MIICTSDPEADRAFFRDVLQRPHVDAHAGWLILAKPPAELACHPLMDEAENHEIYLMRDAVEALVTDMARHGRSGDGPHDTCRGVRHGYMQSVGPPYALGAVMHHEQRGELGATRGAARISCGNGTWANHRPALCDLSIVRRHDPAT
ncbi:MAG: extradiol dioxygenase [bacterium]|nr:extradiol dioxygenase [bacterium]